MVSHRAPIFFYFKKCDGDEEEDGSEQPKEVRSFQQRLREDGVLYWEFGRTRELEPLLRVHLAKMVIRRSARQDRRLSAPPPMALDLRKQGQHFQHASGLLLQMTAEMRSFSETLSAESLVLQRAAARGSRNAQAVLMRTATILSNASDRLSKGVRNRLGQFSVSVDRGFQDIADLIMASSGTPAAKEILDVLRGPLGELSEGSSTGMDSFHELREMLLSVDLRGNNFLRARSELRRQMGRFLDEANSVTRMTREALRLIEEFS